MSMATPVMKGPVRLPMPQRTPMGDIGRDQFPAPETLADYGQNQRIHTGKQAAPDKQQDPKQMVHTDDIR